MKYLRTAIACIVVLGAVAGIGALALISPPVQTWLAQYFLAGGALVHGTVESVDASNGRAEIGDLHLESRGALLTVPSIEARLSVTEAILHRRFALKALSAKGWMLDLTKCEDLVEAPSPSADAETVEKMPAERAVAALLGLVNGPGLPWDVSLDGADLEGDVILPPRTGSDPTKVHVVMSGGGLGQGRDGTFSMDLTTAATDADLRLTAISVHGRLTLTMDSSRSVSHMSCRADMVLKNPSLPSDLDFTADASVGRGARGQTYALVIGSGARTPLELHGQFSPAERSHTGAWKLDLLDSDLRAFFGDRPLPRFWGTGEGSFETDTAFGRLALSGGLLVKASGLEALSPALAPLGSVRLSSDFAVTVIPGQVRIERLSAQVSGKEPALQLSSLQAFSVRTANGEILPSEPGADLLGVRFTALPASWLDGLEHQVAFPGGTVLGACTLGAADGGFTLRSTAPIAINGASLAVAGRTLAKDLFLSFGLRGDWSPKGHWSVTASSVDVTLSGRHLASLEAGASSPGADGSIPVSCRFVADLAALPSPPDAPLVGWPGAKTLKGEVHAGVGDSTAVDAKVDLSGRLPSESMSASLHLDMDGDGSAAFLGPVKMTTADGTSEMTADGTWSWAGPDNHINLKLTGARVSMEHLEMLLGPVASATPAGQSGMPFWGRWQGSIAGNFDTFVLGGRELSDLGGTLDLEHGSIGLLGGHATVKDLGTVRVSATLAHYPASTDPYEVSGTATLGTWDASHYLGISGDGHSPLLEGKFSVEASLTGKGRSLGSVLSAMTESFHLHAANGIFRLLETNIEDTIPEAKAPVKDALSSVGSAVGTLFGKRDAPIYALGKNAVDPHAEAVIRLANDLGEIGFDSMDVRGTRGPDGSLALDSLDFLSAEVRLTGTGRIGPGKDAGALPLRLELTLSAKGDTAGEIAKAGLLSSRKDEAGYTVMDTRAILGGTLKQVDAGQWHDELGRAANRKPAEK